MSCDSQCSLPLLQRYCGFVCMQCVIELFPEHTHVLIFFCVMFVTVSAPWLFFKALWVRVQCVIVVFHDHTHLLYKEWGYSMDVMRQSACLVVNPIEDNGYVFHFNCTTVGQA